MIRLRDLEPEPTYQNRPDAEAVLDAHRDDGTGYCAAGCNLRGWQYRTGTCPPARAARKTLDRLNAARANGRY